MRLLRVPEVAVALAKCEKIEASATINNGIRDMPWIKTPIYYVDQSNIAEFVCTQESANHDGH